MENLDSTSRLYHTRGSVLSDLRRSPESSDWKQSLEVAIKRGRFSDGELDGFFPDDLRQMEATVGSLLDQIQASRDLFPTRNAVRVAVTDLLLLMKNSVVGPARTLFDSNYRHQTPPTILKSVRIEMDLELIQAQIRAALKDEFGLDD